MSVSGSPQALHLRWRMQACARVVLFALPWIAVALFAALRAPKQVPTWMAVVASLLVTAAALIRLWRLHDMRWLAATLNTHVGLEDSAELLLGAEPRPLTELVNEDGNVVGAVVSQRGQAMRIRAAFEAKGCAMLFDSPTNQQFPIPVSYTHLTLPTSDLV